MFVDLFYHAPSIHISFIARRIETHELWTRPKSRSPFQEDHHDTIVNENLLQTHAAYQKGMRNDHAEQLTDAKYSLKIPDATIMTRDSEIGVDLESRDGEVFGADIGFTVPPELGPEFLPNDQSHMEAGDEFITIDGQIWDSTSLSVYKQSPSHPHQLTPHGLLSLPGYPKCFRQRGK